MIAYILDSLNFKPGAFFGVWASLIAAQVAFFFSSSLILTFNSIPLGLLAALLCAQTNFLIGAWASLQFKWVQLENPTIVLALERLLFACVPFAASSIFTWATTAAVGIFRFPSPLNYLLVTVTMLGGAAGAGASALGMISDAFSSVAFTALAVTVSSAGAIVVGFPLLGLQCRLWDLTTPKIVFADLDRNALCSFSLSS
ncbi:hypothetical protein OIU76_003740 [Salix suchowensis]|nr:hypothetical protein OIU76_003740 [Salix suchowensis]